MNRIWTIFLVAVLMMAATAGCAGATTTRLDLADEGSDVKLKVGDILEIALEGNPTTGYVWMLVGETEPVLGHADEPEYVADETAANVVGAGGTFTFVFEALQQGEVQLELAYMRPWESVPPIETYRLSVTVE